MPRGASQSGEQAITRQRRCEKQIPKRIFQKRAGAGEQSQPDVQDSSTTEEDSFASAGTLLPDPVKGGAAPETAEPNVRPIKQRSLQRKQK